MSKEGIRKLSKKVDDIIDHLSDLNDKSCRYNTYRSEIIKSPNIETVDPVERLPPEVYDGWYTVSVYLDFAYTVKVQTENGVCIK